MVDRASHVPLYSQIEDALYEQISSGELPPGTQIPSETELAERYHVARMTVRKALDRLEARRLIFRQAGKGTFVSESTPLSYRLSTILSFSRSLRARGYDVTTKVVHLDVIPAPATVARALRLSVNSDVVLIHRLRFLEGKPVAVHITYLDYVTFGPILEQDLVSESLLVLIEQIIGKNSISYSIDSVHATSARQEDADLLEIAVGSPVLQVEGTSFTEHGHPIHYNNAIYAGDRFRLMVRNTASQASALKPFETDHGFRGSTRNPD